MSGNDKYWYERWELHRWFDKLWRNHSERQVMYQRLANELQIDPNDCHFSTLTKEQLDIALKVVKKWWLEKYDI